MTNETEDKKPLDKEFIGNIDSCGKRWMDDLKKHHRHRLLPFRWYEENY